MSSLDPFYIFWSPVISGMAEARVIRFWIQVQDFEPKSYIWN